jgi:hypothetical protein
MHNPSALVSGTQLSIHCIFLDQICCFSMLWRESQFFFTINRMSKLDSILTFRWKRCYKIPTLFGSKRKSWTGCSYERELPKVQSRNSVIYFPPTNWKLSPFLEHCGFMLKGMTVEKVKKKKDSHKHCITQPETLNFTRLTVFWTSFEGAILKYTISCYTASLSQGNVSKK